MPRPQSHATLNCKKGCENTITKGPGRNKNVQRSVQEYNSVKIVICNILEPDHMLIDVVARGKEVGKSHSGIQPIVVRKIRT